MAKNRHSLKHNKDYSSVGSILGSPILGNHQIRLHQALLPNETSPPSNNEYSPSVGTVLGIVIIGGCKGVGVSYI